MDKLYLGDGVYVEYDEVSNATVLYTSNGICETNRIYLEQSVAQALFNLLIKKGYIQAIQKV